jgi:signal peptidase II
MIKYFVILVTVVLVDQLSEQWIVSTFTLYDIREIIPGFFNLVYFTNKGAAFSLFASYDSPIRHYFFVTVKVVAFIGLTIGAYTFRFRHPLYPISFAFIAGGATGNLIDRLRFGAVTDLLDFYIGAYHWPAFNGADSAIFIGVFLLFITNFYEMKNEKKG